MKITISSTRSKSFNKQIDFVTSHSVFKQVVLHQTELMKADCSESVFLTDRCRGLIGSKSQPACSSVLEQIKDVSPPHFHSFFLSLCVFYTDALLSGEPKG